MIGIGEQIKQARLGKNISLEEISHRLRINSDYLRDIEQDKFDFLPKPYVLAFTKIFANFVGLNGEEIVAPLREHTAASPALPVPVAAAPEARWLEESSPSPAGRGSAVRMAETQAFKSIPYAREILISLGIILAIALLLYFVSRSQPDAAEEASSVEASPPPASSEPAPEVTLQQMVQKAQEDTKTDSTTATPEGLSLEARVSAQVWTRLIIDNKDTLEATLPAGRVQAWQAKDNFRLRLGNVNALRLTLNGQPLSSLGVGNGPGNFLITRDGIVSPRPRSPGRTPRTAADSSRGR